MIRSVKTKRTYYTAEKVANIRKNIGNFDWAKEKAEKIIEKAEYYLAYGVDRSLFDIANETIKRSVSVNQKYGCPHCGAEMQRYGDYGWLIDIVNHPWKVRCPACGRLYPSNDFEAFYRSGQDEHGMFSYDRADRSLLVNTLYPEEGPDYAVDDGHGWLRDRDDPRYGRFAFIPYYVAVGMWWNKDARKYETNFVRSALHSLSEAYMITEDRRYGVPAAALLYKIAELYPTMDISLSPWSEGYCKSDFCTDKGRFLGCIWDTSFVSQLVGWYDMLFPCLDDAVAAYIRENPVRYAKTPPESGADVKDRIENNLLLQVYPDAKARILNCNPGPPHEMLLKTGVVLQRDDLFEEYAAYTCYGGDMTLGSKWIPIDTLFSTGLTRDGISFEVSPGYNSMWSIGFMGAAKILKGTKYDLFRDVRFLKLGDAARQVVTCGNMTLHIGDTAQCGDPVLSVDLNSQAQYFLVTKKPMDAALLVKKAGDGPICTDWTEDCEAVDREIREAAASVGAFVSESRCLSGYGLAAIESQPVGKDPESHTVFFGQNAGHGHKDTMNLTLHGFGIDLMPDHGYPDFANSNYLRMRWTDNMIAHNTAMIPQTVPYTSEEVARGTASLCNLRLEWKNLSKIHHYYTDGKVSLIDAECPDLYNELFRRTVVSVDTDGKTRYLLDLFDVGGEGGQRMSWHAIGTKTNVCGVEFVPQNGGSYAGEDVPYMDEDYSAHYSTGFNFLKDVKRAAKPDAGFTVDWKCVDNWHVWENDRDVHVKLHALSAVEEAALCIGQPPQTKLHNPREMAYLILKNGEGQAHFTHLLEPYENAPFVDRCMYAVDGDTITVTVFHRSGRTDTIMLTRTGNGCRLKVQSTDGYEMTYGDTVLTGTVVDFTRDYRFEHFVTMQFDADFDAASVVGRFVDIDTDEKPCGFYEIKSAEVLGGGLVRFGTGDCTFAASKKRGEDGEVRVAYSASEGAIGRITL